MQKKNATWTRWSQLIAGQEVSGLSQRAFSEKHGLNFSTFSHWRQRIKRVERQAIGTLEESKFKTIEIVTGEELKESRLVISLQSYQAELVVQKGDDLVFLKEVLAALC